MQKTEDILRSFRLLASHGDVAGDNHGNVSVKITDGEMIIKPSGYRFDEITEDSLVYVCYDSDGICGYGGDIKPSVDVQHHAKIYTNYPYVGAICHTHSPYATSIAMNHHPIRCTSTEHADLLGHDVRCLMYSDFDSWGEEFFLLSPEEKCVLLAYHGTISVGKTAVEAVKNAIALEQIAQKYHLACSLFGREPAPLPYTEMTRWHERYTTKYGQG